MAKSQGIGSYCFHLGKLHYKRLQHDDGGRHCHYVAALLDKVTSAINPLAKGRFSPGQLGDGSKSSGRSLRPDRGWRAYSSGSELPENGIVRKRNDSSDAEEL